MFKKIFGASKESHFDAGMKLFNEGRYEEAIRCYDEALRIDPHDVNIRNNKGWALNSLGRYEEAIRCYDEALRINPRNADIHNNKGWALNNLGRYAEAIRYYDEALRINPRNADIHNNKGWALNNLGRYEEAIRCYDEALRINPHNVNIYNNKGWALHNLGRYEEAIRCYDEALRIDPSHKYVKINKQAALAKISAVKSLPAVSPVVKPAATSTTDRLPIGGSGASTVAIGDELAKLKLQMAEAEERAKRAELAALEEARKRELAEQKAKPAVTSPFTIIPYKDLSIGRELGKGGCGIVYEAKWAGMNVALKSLLMTDLPERLVAEFNNEALLHAGLHHENVVELKGVCLEPKKYALVMELMPNGSLFNVLHNGKDLPWSLRLSIAKDIANGLSYLHQHGIIHQDLKSLNVLLDGRMRAKLSDFGLSDIKAGTATSIGAMSKATDTVTGPSAPGSILWMAPELFRRGGKSTEASDTYAMGVVFWELASRDLPFKDARGSEALVIKWVTDGDREEIPAETPAKLASLIGRCWAAKIEDRPKSAKAVLAELMETVVVGGGASVSASSEPAEKSVVDSGYPMFSH